MAKKVVLPWELKADFRIKGWSSTLRGFLYAIREEYGAAAALKMYERVQNMDDRVKNLTKTIQEIFKIEGNNMKAIQKWWNIYWELTETEYTWLEFSKTFSRVKITKCPWKTEHKDICDWDMIFINIIDKTINPKTTIERTKAMCAEDPYCEFVTKIQE